MIFLDSGTLFAVYTVNSKITCLTNKLYQMGKVVGIDLGTGYSAVATVTNGKPEILENSEGKRTTASVITIDEKGERTVGDAAKRKMVTLPKNTVSFIKRFMGVDFKDADVQKMLGQISYDVVAEKDPAGVEWPKIKINGRLYSPIELSSMILQQMKKVAEDKLGEEVTDAVITCPAWYGDNQRNAVKAAGEAAGLKVLRIINEPTAAILASNIDYKTKDKTVLVVDLGCGTCDCICCEVSDIENQEMVEVGATNGNNFLGGQNYDARIVDWVVEEFKKDKGVDLSKDPMAYSRIIEAAEKAKCELSTSTSSEINLPYITSIDNQPQFLLMTLTRAKFEDLTRDLTDEVKELALGCIEKAGKSTSDIDEILLIGGATRMPCVQEALASTGIKLNKSSNPDEAVALGAAIQANQLATGGKDLLLLDVTPLSLGIETLGGVFTKLIEANTTIPTHKEETFSTAVDNQPGVQISVYQGERPMCADNKLIGNFNLDGIMPAPRGVPQILVSFDIDANGILNVSAKDKATGKEQHVTIQAQSGLSKDEIERIKAEAEAHKAEDAKKEEEIKKINQAESMVYGLEDAIKNAGDKITEDEKKSIQPDIDKVKELVKERKADEAEAAVKALNEKFAPIAQRLYSQSAGPGPEAQAAQAGSSASTAPDDSKVEEADFEEVK